MRISKFYRESPYGKVCGLRVGFQVKSCSCWRFAGAFSRQRLTVDGEVTAGWTAGSYSASGTSSSVLTAGSRSSDKLLTQPIVIVADILP